ncbi:DUF5686 family protein [uncultured Sunxiuqinia sp.]|uniref:DUF5686 family protein n=1 Tax=uncultured Sunxiuqinia sp. TaxID=1573825 RepID=UPI0026253C7F|nr:DUF5686 family protein [uncultured Sunxiuqinia sp.]
MKLTSYAMKKIAFFLTLLVFGSQLVAQTLTIRVVDADTSRPLPFVNVLFDTQNRGTTTNIDGFFNMDAQETDSIELSYVGYSRKKLAVQHLQDGDRITLEPAAIALDEVEVVPGENPADRIMKKVVENRELHRPKNLDSYYYQSYNKMTFSLTDETRTRFLESLGENPDSSQLKLKRFVDQQDLFLLESVSEKAYRKPQKEKEVIIASRVSGLEDPSFFLLATQLQSFTFYQDYIKLFEKQFLSPVSPNSWNKYLFILEETLFTPTGDSLFVIRFYPRKNKNFEGLKGVLKISSDGYAIESLRVQAADQMNKRMVLSIEQVYDQLPSGHWFPKALNSEISFAQLNLPGINFPDNSLTVRALGKTYFSKRVVNVPLEKEKLQGAQLSVSPSATQQSDSNWEALRSVPLSHKDSLIYQFVDSLGQQVHFDAKMNAIESLAGWRVPLWPVDLLLDRVAGFNHLEGLHLGLALETNPSFSERLLLGGYWRYGLKDKVNKYGANLGFKVDKESATKLFVLYENDLRENGAIQFLEQKEPFISRQLEAWYRTNFSYHQLYQAGVEGRLFPSLLARAYWKNYQIMDPWLIDGNQSLQALTYNKLGVQFRLTFKERLFRRRGEIYSLGGRYPVLHFNYERAVRTSSDRAYSAIEFKLSDSYQLRNLGESEFTLLGSLREAGGVVNLLSSPPASRPQLFSFYSKSSFSTMRINEFFTDELLAFFWRHNFGSLLFRYKKVRPDILLAFNAGIGSTAYDFQDGFASRYPSINKGYYEGGILVSKLVKFGFFTFGTGAFYRFGPYRLDSFQKNLALKFTIDLAI